MTRLTLDEDAPSPQEARKRFERIDKAPDGVAGMRRTMARLAWLTARLVTATAVAVLVSSQFTHAQPESRSMALFVNNLFDELALLSFDQERGTRARVGFLTNQPRTFGISTRLDF